MTKEIIMLSSYTYAQKARDYLYKNGIYARVIKTPEKLSSCGCGHSVETEAGHGAAELLEEAGFPVKRSITMERSRG